MGYRTDNYGRGQALTGDKTSTGATCIGSLPYCTEHGRGVVRVGDKTTPCKNCGKPGTILDGEPRVSFHGVAAAVDRSNVRCGCPPGTNFIIAPIGDWLGSGPSPEQIVRERHAVMLAERRAEQEREEKHREEERERNRVFAKSCLRGEGCNDAGDQREPHTNFADMAFFQAMPASDPVTDSDTPQHAQTARKKKPEDIPKPKKRSALYRWWNGNHEEMDYQAAVAAASAAARAQTATAGASLLELISGRALTYGTWAVRGAVAGPGAPVAGLLVGMMPGRLNDGEQDFIDRMRLEQMHEAPSRVRYTWEKDSRGNPVPHGWHTPPGRDSVRVRKMEYDTSAQAYTFTTEEDPHITIIWTPDRTVEEKPWNTGNQARPVLPKPVIVDPLPDNTGITATTSPAPEEKHFADYILILPFPDLPPIYIYLSKPPVEFLEVELYSDFKRRSRQGVYEADHMPSAAAVKAYLRREYPYLKETEIQEFSLQVAAIVVPKDVHQKISETYGGRNTLTQIDLDSQNLRAAADRNLDTIKPSLKKQGATEEQIETARTKMHALNGQQGLYK
ncbi:S-type pyocin domain-containing protein [Enterobacter bugandensis]|uniref:S-type pyocin domain-containing protein n=1 Tax=Enterobacter TaxID=547 RepID=UPI00092E863B|nr:MULTISPECIES: S-type pyocin domain-containing protein [Enterobacter]EKS6886066.1 S-type pyocin domain-containing protein [Enterobacter bugandensis]EKS6889963.1 S-type pyocin domain-containing protein [Enterobacter bugandensis]EKS6928467.1 S-type pyocin domain-containing protein [Enterobacter bugandensis]EKS7119138.1 S-type pyocin domain-containing protein [Enterobacter bugandensis]EKS7122756.1 S-type pyocin domain-containing protein [Enterobacter bugandensis]